MLRHAAAFVLALVVAPGCGPKVETDDDSGGGGGGSTTDDFEPGDPTDTEGTSGRPVPGTSGRPDPATTANPVTSASSATATTADPTDATFTTTSTTSDASGGLVPTFLDVQVIFEANCTLSGCHDGTVGPMHNNYDAIVGVPSTQTDLNYIEPGDVAASYLWHKIAGTQVDIGGVGAQMPVGGMLTDDEFVVIADWISAGAPL